MAATSVKLIVYPVTDIEKAKTFYNQFLGTEPYVDTPYYVGYRMDNLEIGLDPNSESGPIAYTDVEDINVSLKELSEAGGDIVQGVKNVGNGLLIAQAKDSKGNIVGLRQQS